MINDDPELSRSLKSWRHEPPPAPRFNAEVWTRIEAAREVSWAGRWLGLPARHVRWMMPLGAALMLTLAAFLGAGAGYLQSARTRTDRMAAAYIKTVDPFQMTASSGSEP